MAQLAEKSIKIKAVVGEPKGYIARGVKDGSIKTDNDGIPEDNQVIPLCFVVGRAREKGDHGRTKANPTTGEVSKDTWPVLLGDFECVPVDSMRDTHRAPKAFLADHIIEAVAMALTDLRKGGEIEPVVEIAMRVDAVTDSAASAGFTYRWTPLHQEKPKHDPLDHMRQLIGKPEALAITKATSDEAPEEAGDEPGETDKPPVATKPKTR